MLTKRSLKQLTQRWISMRISREHREGIYLWIFLSCLDVCVWCKWRVCQTYLRAWDKASSNDDDDNEHICFRALFRTMITTVALRRKFLDIDKKNLQASVPNPARFHHWNKSCHQTDLNMEILRCYGSSTPCAVIYTFGHRRSTTHGEQSHTETILDLSTVIGRQGFDKSKS